MSKKPEEIALNTLIEELTRRLAPILAIPKVWLDEKEVAGYLSLSTHLLRKWRCQGEGPIYYRVGNRILYNRDLLDNWMQTHQVKGDGHGGT